jgi:3-oxoadipate enol-lactonase
VSVPLHHSLHGPSDAPVLVLAGSLGTSLEMWDDQVPGLAERFRVLRYDQRGHGRSPVPPGPYSIADLGGDLLALLDELGLERVSLCGLSIGGMTAMWTAIEAPERIERLVLCSTSAHLPPAEAWEKRAAIVRERGVDAVAELVLGRWFTPPFVERRADTVKRLRDQLVGTPPEGYAGCCEAIAAHDLRDRLGAIGAPTLVLTGADDPITTPEHGELIAESIPSARFQLVPEAAHLANVEQPEAITQAVLEHLATETSAEEVDR